MQSPNPQLPKHLLRIGYAGGNAALTNIDREGFASAAFHSYPDTLKWDAYSGDYGMNFFGYAMNAATYVVDMKEFGWREFGGNIETMRSRNIAVIPRDVMRRRVYIAPFGLWLVLDSGSFSAVEISRTVTAYFDEGPQDSVARLRVEQSANVIGNFRSVSMLRQERGAYVIPTDRSDSQIKLAVAK